MKSDDLPEDIPESIKDMLRKMTNNPNVEKVEMIAIKGDNKKNNDQPFDNIMAHYAVKDKDYEDWWESMFCDLFKKKNKSYVLDKWFPTLDNEGRVKVLAFARALEEINDYNYSKMNDE